MATVSVYSKAGFQRILPSLNVGRKNHACSNFVSDGEKVKRYSAVSSSVKYKLVGIRYKCDQITCPICLKTPRGIKNGPTDKSWVSFEKFRKFSI